MLDLSICSIIVLQVVFTGYFQEWLTDAQEPSQSCCYCCCFTHSDCDTAGMSCLECHHTEGHLMAKGTHTTTMMANDLPHTEVSCLDCHDDPPHDPEGKWGSDLNDHLEKIACQTCHIPYLHSDNVTRRDFSKTEFEEHPGIFIYDDIKKESKPGRGIAYVWWNGDCTFLGNPTGDNPNEAGLYTFYDAAQRWPEFKEFDYTAWYEEIMRPIARSGRKSKIYPMKRFTGRQHIDLANMGLSEECSFLTICPTITVMGMMYGWNIDSYEDVLVGKNVEPRWLPTDAMLEISHSIRLEGALECNDCHGPDGIMDWVNLGYTEEESSELSQTR